MVEQKIIGFLQQVRKHNNKVWFDAHRKDYEAAREDFLALVQQIITTLGKIDGDLASLTAKESVFRINRDVRFSKNKDPYKSNMSAYFNRAGKKSSGAGYYVHIEPGKSFVAAGVWMPEGEALKKIRQEIDYNFKDWKAILQRSSFKKKFTNGLDASNSLVRAPKGYVEENPAIEFLKLKSFVVTRSFSDDEITGKQFLKELAATFKEAKPVVDFINIALEG